MDPTSKRLTPRDRRASVTLSPGGSGQLASSLTGSGKFVVKPLKNANIMGTSAISFASSKVQCVHMVMTITCALFRLLRLYSILSHYLVYEKSDISHQGYISE